MRKTKIICTLGPAVETEQSLKGLIAEGMDVARLANVPNHRAYDKCKGMQAIVIVLGHHACFI